MPDETLPDWMKGARPATQERLPDWMKGARPAASFGPIESTDRQQAHKRMQELLSPVSVTEPSEIVAPFAKGAAAGFGKTVLGAEQMVGNLFGSERMLRDVERGKERIEKELSEDRKAHPYATGAGEIAGSLALPGSVAAKLTRSARAASVLGGGLGALLQPESPEIRDYWLRKAKEAGVGAAAGIGTHVLVRGASDLVIPKLTGAVKTLVEEGVVLTPGQLMGGAAKRTEDTLASVPITGSFIRNAQRQSVETFNRAAINRSLSDIGVKLPADRKSGHEAILFAEQQFVAAYKNVVPRMTGHLDSVFRDDLVDIALRAQSKNLPQEFQDQLRHIISSEVVSRFLARGGQITGEEAQEIGTQLDTLMKAMRVSPNPYIQDLGRFVKDLDKSLDAMMARNNPKLQAMKDKIDAGYSKFKTVQRAAKEASPAGTTPGTFTPAQLRAAVLSRDPSKDKASFARGDAQMQDLAEAAREVIPQIVPDSGTPERAAMLGLIGGAGHYDPRSLAVLGALAAPYARPVVRGLNTGVAKATQPPSPTRKFISDLVGSTGPVIAPGAGRQASEELVPTPSGP